MLEPRRTLALRSNRFAAVIMAPHTIAKQNSSTRIITIFSIIAPGSFFTRPPLSIRVSANQNQ